MEHLKSKTNHAEGYIRHLRTALREANEKADQWRKQVLDNADDIEALELTNKALRAANEKLKMQVAEWKKHAFANMDRCNAFMKRSMELNAETEKYFAKMVQARAELIAVRMKHPEIFNDSDAVTAAREE